ncbi:MAG: TIGR00282 family metallophosphoesterase [Akkermansia sp.]
MLNILFVGDIVGEPGRMAYMRALPDLKEEFSIDVAIANAENAAAGRGLTPRLAQQLLAAGTSVVTTGDHVWDQPDFAPWIDCEVRVLRPLNYPANTPGHGSVIIDVAGCRMAVMQLQGRSFIQPPLENPFLLGKAEAIRLRQEEGVNVIFVDVHAETTSEKIAMGYHLDGCVSAVVGTHTHVQTADEIIHEGGTACLTDVGMCGPALSVLGRDKDQIIKRFCTSMPTKFPVAKGEVRLCGVIIRVDERTGKAVNITRIQRIID